MTKPSLLLPESTGGVEKNGVGMGVGMGVKKEEINCQTDYFSLKLHSPTHFDPDVCQFEYFQGRPSNPFGCSYSAYQSITHIDPLQDCRKV